MSAHRPRNPSRLRTLVQAIIAALLPLVMSGAARPQAPDKKVEDQTISADMNLCGPSRQHKTDWDDLTDRDDFCLRGKVRTLTGEGRWPVMPGTYLFGGNVHAITKHHFDERGNRILTEVGDGRFGSVGVVYHRKLVLSFDAQGRLTGWKSFGDRESGVVQELVCSYDGRGNLVRMETKRLDKGARMIYEYSYDAEGRKAEERTSHLRPEGWKTGKITHTYDGNLTHSRAYSRDGVTTKGLRVLKDERGNLLSEEHYRLDARGEEDVWRKVTYEYDRRGFRTEIVYHKADEEPHGARVVYEYDERDNVASVTRYGADGSFDLSEHREYEYDAAGNWVRRVSSRRLSEHGAAQPYRVERRRLTYY